ncbi:MAG: hypothetical protein ACD_23C00614G0001 [uncultured bacterium]|nr:MAG: hypothetical protein ACD_23C00614G0001 [uncultured bacterium]
MVISVLSTLMGRVTRICVENWSIRYTLGYRHRLRVWLTMLAALSSPRRSFSSSRRL